MVKLFGRNVVIVSALLFFMSTEAANAGCSRDSDCMLTTSPSRPDICALKPGATGSGTCPAEPSWVNPACSCTFN